jgi:hypothetical protein
MTVIHKKELKSLPKKRKVKFIVSLTVFLMIFATIITVLNSALSYAFIFNNYFSNEIPLDESEFMSTDPAFLALRAENFEKYMDLYNRAANLTGDGWDYYPISDSNFAVSPNSLGIYNQSMFLEQVDPFDVTHPLNQLRGYSPGGHSSAYAGFLGIGEGARYAIAMRENDTTALALARSDILKMVKGFDILSAVTGNGAMARVVAPDTPIARAAIEAGFYEQRWTGSHLFYPVNYTGPNNVTYTFFVETGTSVDCYLGVYGTLGMIYALCNDTEIREIIRGTIDRMLEYHINSGWRFVDYDGKTHSMGAEAMTGSPFTDSAYAMTFLRVGATVHPEKWGKMYREYAYDRMQYFRVGKHVQIGITGIFAWSGGYFNLNLATTVAGVLCFLETDPSLRTYYRNHFLTPLHEITKNHRNAWFDVLYYLGMSNLNADSYENSIQIPNHPALTEQKAKFIDANVGDALMRIALTRFPYRNFPHANGLSSYASLPYCSPIPGAPYPDVQIFDWRSKIDPNNPFHQMLADFANPGTIWDQPTPADWRGIATWMWEGNPFSTGYDASGGGDWCPPSGSFTAPYWLGRYLGFESLTV